MEFIDKISKKNQIQQQRYEKLLDPIRFCWFKIPLVKKKPASKDARSLASFVVVRACVCVCVCVTADSSEPSAIVGAALSSGGERRGPSRTTAGADAETAPATAKESTDRRLPFPALWNRRRLALAVTIQLNQRPLIRFMAGRRCGGLGNAPHSDWSTDTMKRLINGWSAAGGQ